MNNISRKVWTHFPKIVQPSQLHTVYQPFRTQMKFLLSTDKQSKNAEHMKNWSPLVDFMQNIIIWTNNAFLSSVNIISLEVFINSLELFILYILNELRILIYLRHSFSYIFLILSFQKSSRSLWAVFFCRNWIILIYSWPTVYFEYMIKNK